MFRAATRTTFSTLRGSRYTPAIQQISRLNSTIAPNSKDTWTGVSIASPQAFLNRSMSETAVASPNPELPNSYVKAPTDKGVSPLVANYMARSLNAKVYSAINETPLQYAPKLSAKLKNRVLLKREDLTPVFSFKIRGAFNKMASLTPEERAKGVVACSAGNHAQGVGFAAKHLGIKARIFMPALAPQMKIEAVRSYGVDVELVDGSFSEAEKKMKEYVATHGSTIVHPFDDPAVIAGQGTIGLEILKQLGGDAPDAVFLSCGGGGMLAGVGAIMKATSAGKTKVVGANSLDSVSMTESLKAGHRVRLDSVGNFADGAAVALIGKETFAVASEVVDEMMAVSTDELCTAIKDIFSETRVVAEPAGALGLAALKKYIEKHDIEGQTLVAVVSGANMDFDKLRFVAERADQSESLLCVEVPERPGAFALLMRLIKPRPVTEFACRIEDPNLSVLEDHRNVASVFVAVRCESNADEMNVLETLESHGYPTINLTKNQMARRHGRYLVGGRAPAQMEDEEVVTFEFLNASGALYNFVEAVSHTFNATLWSYRNHGHDMCRVMVGFQVPSERKAEFEAWRAALPYKQEVETGNPMYKHFFGRQHISVQEAARQAEMKFKAAKGAEERPEFVRYNLD